MSEPVGPDTRPIPMATGADHAVVPLQGGWAVAALVAVLVVLLVLWGVGAGYDFKAKVRGRNVSVTGKRVSPGLRSSLLQFFQNDFPPKQQLTVYVRRRANRTYELRFHGPVTAGEKQQIRNFLTSGV